MVKKGINAWCFSAEHTLERCMMLAKDAGYDGIELNMAEPPHGESGGLATAGLCLTPDTSDSDYAAIAKLSREYGLPISGISTALHWEYPLTDNCADKREKGKLVVRSMIDAAAALGAGVVLVVPGLVTKDVAYDTAYDRAIEAFNELKSYAEAKNIVIGIENVWNKFLLSPLEVAQFIDKIGSDYVGMYFDAGNVLQSGYPDQWVRILGKRIVRVHVKDFSRDVGNISGFTTLLNGDMDWSALVQALGDIGYDSYLTAELAPYKFYPNRLAYDTSKALDCILGL